MDLKISMDTSAVKPLLASLVEAAKLRPEIREGLLNLIDSGEELFSFNRDRSLASSAGELVVGLDPSDGLLRLLAAAGAGDRDLFAFEHLPSLVGGRSDQITT